MKKLLLYILVSTIILSIIIIIIFRNDYFIQSEKYLNNTIKGELNEIINKRIINDIQTNNISFKEIVSYGYLNNGKISSIQVDTQSINVIANDITVSIQEAIRDSQNKFGIPITNIMGSKLFAGKGPKLSVNIMKSGAVNYKIESELLSGGINQTIHRIVLIFNTKIDCISPFQNLTCNIENTLIVTETLIVGDIPEIILPSGR